ncbi:MAG TPA: biotin--[acetyl-CoA-carboxylase] ligase [Chloroflexota bacterium]|nr:biotin--[acetyl-CoA-carboxylase] ligase [Chloroflexota bacterium]
MVREDPPRGGGTPLGVCPLAWAAIESALRGQTIGQRIVYRASTGSTNDDAKALAAAGEPEGTVILADEQTAGRGRAGKSRWITPAATSMAASILLRPVLRPERLGTLAMVAGLAAVAAVRQTAGLDASLKWPNDVLAGDRKLGGILVESALGAAGIAYAVIGIGLNGNLRAADLGSLPDAAVPPTTLLEATGHPIEREPLLIALLQALDARYAQLTTGGSTVLRDYRAALSTLGQPVTVTGGGTTHGTAEDVTDTGALILRLPDGSHRELAYGEVTVRSNA